MTPEQLFYKGEKVESLIFVKPFDCLGDFVDVSF